VCALFSSILFLAILYYNGCRIVFGILFASGVELFFAFFPGTICLDSLELERVILHGICHVSALQPLICMVFARFWYFKRSCGFLESFFTVSCRVSFQVSFRVSLEFRLGFLLGFI
jgi:hypothetical protein